MLKTIASIPFVVSLIFAGALLFATPATARGDHWGFSLNPGGIGFHYGDHHDGHRHHRHHNHHNRHWGHHYRPYGYTYQYFRPYQHPYYAPRYYYPGGLSFHFD